MTISERVCGYQLDLPSGKENHIVMCLAYVHEEGWKGYYGT